MWSTDHSIICLLSSSVPIAPYIGKIIKENDSILLEFESPEGISDEFVITLHERNESLFSENPKYVENTGMISSSFYLPVINCSRAQCSCPWICNSLLLYKPCQVSTSMISC